MTHIMGKKNTKCRVRYHAQKLSDVGEYFHNPQKLKAALCHISGLKGVSMELEKNESGDWMEETEAENKAESGDGNVVDLGNLYNKFVSENLSEGDDNGSNVDNEGAKNVGPAGIEVAVAEEAGIAEIRGNFNAYAEKAEKDFVELQAEFKVGIELMKLLNDAGASLALYKKIFDWHMKHSETVRKVTKKELLKRLRKRYNMQVCSSYFWRHSESAMP